MINGFVVVAFISYLVMLLAFYLRRNRKLHIPLMSSIIVFDLCVPFYLFMNRDWKTRLIDSGDILSFGVWMHFGLVLTLYVLYVIQVQSALQLTKGDDEARSAHAGQGKAILTVRALAIFTGALLIDPNMEKSTT